MNPKQEHLIACAYHEAGRAVVASILGDDVVDVRINIDAPSVREIHGGVTRSLCCRPVVCRSRTWALKTWSGKYDAYQSKFRTGRPALTWQELTTFMGLTDQVGERVLFTNCDDLPSVMDGRSGFFCIRGADLERLTRRLVGTQACRN